ncbi:MAG: hypothetical protein CW346_14575 [Bacillaceae bacterium]|nr:hypothetical protein [Bacillaceae bacterium]
MGIPRKTEDAFPGKGSPYARKIPFPMQGRSAFENVGSPKGGTGTSIPAGGQGPKMGPSSAHGAKHPFPARPAGPSFNTPAGQPHMPASPASLLPSSARRRPTMGRRHPGNGRQQDVRGMRRLARPYRNSETISFF